MVSAGVRWVASALVLFGAVLVLSPTVSAQAPDTTALDRALVRADDLRRDGQFREVLSRLSALRDEHGDRVEILWRMALTRINVGRASGEEEVAQQHYEEALQLAETALTVEANHAHAHFAKAVVEGRLALDAGTRERVQRSRAVKEHADRAIELDSTLAGAYHVRGRWNREVSDLGFFERAVVKTVYGGLPEASFQQAVRDFRRAIELENVRFHHLELAKTYLKMERPDDARSELQTVLSLPAKEPFDLQYEEEAQSLLHDLE